MTETQTPAFDVTETYVHLPDGGAAIPVEHTPEFWRELASGARRYAGRMMTALMQMTKLDIRTLEDAYNV